MHTHTHTHTHARSTCIIAIIYPPRLARSCDGLCIREACAELLHVPNTPLTELYVRVVHSCDRASCRLCDNFGLTALHKSVGHNNHTATLRLLSDGGCDVNIESSDVASSNAHAHSGSASNEEDYAYIVKTNNKRQTPLHVACKREEFGRYAPADESMVAMLLRWGGDPNRYDADNCTPLHYAARSGDTNTIRLLLKYGADVTLRGGGREESALPFDLLPEGCSPVALELLSGARVVRR